MQKRVVELAEQLLSTVPANEMRNLIRLLTYYNSNFAENDRVKAFRNGSVLPVDRALEEEVRVERFSKTAGSQNVYMVSTSTVCRCCGK